MEKVIVMYNLNCNNCDGMFMRNTKSYLKLRLSNHKISIKSENINAPALVIAFHSLRVFWLLFFFNQSDSSVGPITTLIYVFEIRVVEKYFRWNNLSQFRHCHHISELYLEYI